MDAMEMRKKALKMMGKDSGIVAKGKAMAESEDPEMDMAMADAEEGAEQEMESCMVTPEEKAMIMEMRKKKKVNPMAKMMAKEAMASEEEMA